VTGAAAVMEENDPPRPRGLSEEMFSLLYDELRELARRRMRSERANHTLRPTELVNEVFLRFSLDPDFDLRNRSHFLGLAGRVMRQVLVDYARRRDADKRGGGLIRVTLEEAITVVSGNEVDLIELDDALRKLAAVDDAAAQVVVARFFGGLTEVEIGEAMDRSERWVRDQWKFARSWLRRELDPSRR
jgi:RNA polymerase sigma factor (TIGR02999 family)